MGILFPFVGILEMEEFYQKLKRNPTFSYCFQQNLADFNWSGYMKEFEYVNLMIWLFLRGRPSFTRQSSYETLLKVLGFTILAEANQPQWRCMFEGAQPDMQVFTIWTMYCGMLVDDSLTCEMLMSLFVHIPVPKKEWEVKRLSYHSIWNAMKIGNQQEKELQ